jgi:cysteine desulfurase
VTSATEHHAVLHAASALADQGFEVTLVPCDATGMVSVEGVVDALRPETCLVSIMYANNEVGCIQPIKQIATAARERGIVVHTDAVQAAGALPLSVNDLGVDLLSLSGHKFYGPKGVGLLYVRKGTPIRFQQDGGGQESGRRGGTENVPLIVGFGEALARVEALRADLNQHNAELRDRLWSRLQELVPDARLNGPLPGPDRLANNLNVSFARVQGETVLLGLDMEGVAASAGSACTTGNSEPSHVLLAMGLTEAEARASLRFTTGRGNTLEEMDDAAQITAEVVARTRTLASPQAR